MWSEFLTDFNGAITRSPKSYIHTICSDASLKSYGGTYNSHYVQGTFPELWESYPILLLELFPIYILFEIFKTNFSNSSEKVLCDNSVIVLTAKDPKVRYFV